MLERLGIYFFFVSCIIKQITQFMDKKYFFIIVFIVSLTIINPIVVVGQGEPVTVTIGNPLVGVNNLCDLLTKITSAVAGLVGAVSVIMIIVAGIMYLLSAGSPEKTGAAKKAFFYAIIGIVIALSAGAIVFEIKIIISAAGGGC